MAKSSEYISHRMSEGGKRALKKPESTQLNTPNHAFHVGKVIRQSIGAKVRAFFGWDSSEKRVYNEALFETILEALFQKLKPGEKGKIVIWRILSELFNGPEDVQNALSVQQEKDLIYRIAREKFGKTPEDLLVVALEEIPQHQSLLSSIEEAINPDTHELDTERAFGVKVLPENPRTSLEIAQYLYAATKESPEFMSHLKDTVTARLKSQQKDHQEKLPISYYSLTEIAIRMSDLLNGQNMQGGSSRQEIYDSIIRAIIKGEKEPCNTPVLQRISEVFKGVEFHTIHITTEQSPAYQKMAARNKRARVASMVGVGALVASGAYGTWRHHEQQQEERKHLELARMLASEMNGDTCSMEGPKVDMEIDSIMLASMKNMAVKYMENAYHIPVKEQEKLRIPELFEQFLVINKDPFLKNCYNSRALINAVHSFIDQHRFFLKKQGIEITKPYEHLALFKEDLLALAKGKTIDHKSPENIIYEQNSDDELEAIGTVQAGYGQYKLFRAKGEKILIAKFLSKDNDNSDQQLDAYTAQEAARILVGSVDQYAIIPLAEWSGFLWQLTGDDIPQDVEEEIVVDKWNSKDEKIYRDYFGRFEYKIIQDVYKDPTTKEYKPCLKARTPGEKVYSIKRAREAAKHYAEAEVASLTE